MYSNEYTNPLFPPAKIAVFQFMAKFEMLKNLKNKNLPICFYIFSLTGSFSVYLGYSHLILRQSEFLVRMDEYVHPVPVSRVHDVPHLVHAKSGYAD